jgi:hypothetical protein
MLNQKAKPVRLRSMWNNQEVICDDYSNVRTIDGQDFVEVHLENNPRKFWLNKGPLVRIKEQKSKKS